ncbi:hypothetical protein FI667_g6458, partial [Globisporangium splendens]
MYGDRKGFAIYKPQSRVHTGVQFSSAKEHACTGKEWEDELRQDRIEAEATSSPLPIVMKFANEHYNSLHFRTLNDPSSLATMTSSSLAKHLQGSERSKTEFKTDRSGQFDSEPVTEDPMEESDNSSLEDSVVTPPLGEQEKFEPNELSGSHGWSFASQENQLVVYHSPTTELPPQRGKMGFCSGSGHANSFQLGVLVYCQCENLCGNDKQQRSKGATLTNTRLDLPFSRQFAIHQVLRCSVRVHSTY